ncbi:transcription termination factor MTERF2, chloroplastic-like [Corylus avellana]|uniref:transcription termination factor MTERF2, chloroplastic-like n=1 Tax=Corylus avellana TaxID=13451 RepID=UPI00286D2947|nr:transcription termination factor MTERF2, chloroplastic-like [Corylus avellana]XP_059439093.1 transcription termination factor MTERF2, chloroplastic-like [Corylus avellana]XP_059439094.1 transcription termination factor MTERF2, chloroplastic-like [Corylus avellana]
MFALLCSRQLLLLKSKRTQLGSFQQNAFFILKSFTSIGLCQSSEKQQEEKHSFTVSYLINSCGLSPKSAILASQSMNFDNPGRPDSVLNLLRENGFTPTHISKIIRVKPRFLLYDPEKTLSPKIEFFRSLGVSSSDLPGILSSNPMLLARSLEKQLIPSYDFLKSVVLVNEKVLTALRRSARAFQFNVTTNMAPNVALLRQLGVPQSTISYLVSNYPSQAFTKHTRFAEVVQQVIDMGFNRLKMVFVVAIQVLLKMSKQRFESKLEFYMRWGWSKDMALSAFKRYPICMLLSEEKIMKAMDFLVIKMGSPSADIARTPSVMSYSLEKRIMPRFSVIHILQAKGLVKNDLSSGSIIIPSERCFVEKFLIKFQDDVPELLNVYQGKMGLIEVGSQSQNVCGAKML